VTATRGRTDPRSPGRRPAPRLLRLCVCACALACTDPRARPAPPAVEILIPTFTVHSPGVIAASVVAHDLAGMDSLHVSVQSPDPRLRGDSLYLEPDTTDVTLNVVWNVPDSLPVGTQITLVAKAWNLLGFTAADSVILTSQ
jgi:hypothetical protein